MKTLRIALHGLMLLMADLGGILGGAVLAFKLLGTPNQVWLQIPIALVLTPACFWTWLAAARILQVGRLQPSLPGETWFWWLASLLWAPLIFVPLHFLTQGYWTGFGNLVALAGYQVIVNACTVLPYYFQVEKAASRPAQ